MSTTASTVDTGEREITITREYAAPVASVWAAWESPEALAQWYGPAGFRIVTHSRDFRAGGHWHFVMVGPDGHEYQNRVAYYEVVPGKLLRYSHGGAGDTEHIRFDAEVRFEACGPDRGHTRMSMRSMFPTAEALRYVVENVGAIEGGKQTQQRLADYLAAQAADATVPGSARPFVLTRHFKAPRALVWKAWTDAQSLAQWMSPAGFTTIASDLDLRAGGSYHYGLRTPDGHEMWGLWLIREVVAPERLVTVNSFSDATRGLTRHPMAPTWPAYTLSVIQLAEHAGLGRGTTLTLSWQPYEATPEEIVTFNAAHAGMEQGWGGTLAKLAEWLASQG